MQALTEAGEPDHRTEWKIRLYDIAFLMEDPEELGRVVEIQPEEGLVDLQFTFKRETSSERARGEKEHVQVVHLPLAEPVKAQASTTAEAASRGPTFFGTRGRAMRITAYAAGPRITSIISRPS